MNINIEMVPKYVVIDSILNSFVNGIPIEYTKYPITYTHSNTLKCIYDATPIHLLSHQVYIVLVFNSH